MEHLPQESFRNYFQEGVPCPLPCVPQEETNPRDRTDNANNQVFSTESGGPVIDEISGKQRPDRGCDEEKNSGKCRL